MTESEFEQFRPREVEDYAQELSRNTGTPIEQERANAARQIAESLKNGLQTEGHSFWMITQDGADVGHLWVHIDALLRRAFIYALFVAESHRRHGIGKQALLLLEEHLRPMGITHIGLNVFADNTGAIALYEALSYRMTSHWMEKIL